MKMFRALCLLSLTAVLGGAASGQTVTSTYDEDFSLSRLRVYGFRAEAREKSDPLAEDTVTEKKLREALDDELQGQGFQPPASGMTPDFLVAFHVKTEDKPRGPGGGREYVRGMLVVDFYDAETNRLVWRGIASGPVGAEAVDLKLAEELSKRAAKMLLEQFGRDLLGL